MNNRRNFIRMLGLSGAAALSAEKINAAREMRFDHYKDNHFNMCGYAEAPREKLRVGIIGLGNRGPGAVVQLSRIEGVEIVALCDLRPEKAEAAKQLLNNTIHKPVLYSGGENEWKRLCERNDIDLIYVVTPWHLHAPMAVYAMESGKHVATEVPAAVNVDECWALVKTSEKTRKHCIILENCCYDFFELMTLNMARAGFFGEIIHCEGAYIHDLLHPLFDKNDYFRMWRLKENTRNGNLYPTHGLGPIAQIMNINRGDKMNYLVAMSSDDFMIGQMADSLAEKDDFYKPFAGRKYRGNLNTTCIKTAKGKTIMLQHDVSSPRPYSRIHLVSGSKATAQKYPLPAKIATNHEGWVSDKQFKKLQSEFEPEIVKRIGAQARKIEGHGGMDFLMNWRVIDCFRNGLAPAMDVYDAALWSSIAFLSEKSVAGNSRPIDVPDFTSGSWKNNKPVEANLERGGNTRVL